MLPTAHSTAQPRHRILGGTGERGKLLDRTCSHIAAACSRHHRRPTLHWFPAEDTSRRGA